MNGIERFKLVLLLLLLLCSESCVYDRFANVSTGEEPVKVGFSSYAFTQGGMTVSSFRIIAFNSSGSLEINKTMDDLIMSGNNLTLDLRPGAYTLFAIGNEQAEISPLLDGCTSISEVDAVRINMIENQDSTALPLAWKESIYVRQKPGGSSIGQISLDNTNWLDRMVMETERLASKLELYVRKERASDVVSIKTVTPLNIPKYSHIAPLSYIGEYYSTPLNTNYNVTDDLTLMVDRIYPEHIPASADKNTFVELEMEINGGMQKALIEVGQLDRNKIYKYEILVKSRGIEIEKIEVLPWNQIELDGTVDGVEINFSRVDVPYSFGQESKVYFTTKNIPPMNLSLSPNLYAADGTSIAGQLEGNMDGTHYTYDYNSQTKNGQGLLIIKRSRPSTLKHHVRINAAGISKNILVDRLGVAGSNIYWDKDRLQLVFDDVPQEGERAPHDMYQGVFFFRGSLVALPGGFYKNGPLKNQVWSATGDLRPNGSIDRITAKLPDKLFPFNPNENFGDICLYMTRRGWAPKGKKWKMPTTSDLYPNVITPITYTTIGDPNTPPSVGSLNGDCITPSALKVNNYFVLSHANSVEFSTDKTQSNYSRDYGTGFYSIQDLSANVFYVSKHIGTITATTRALACRCVVDDSPGEVLPLYVVSYDLSGSDAGTISAPTPEGVILNQHVDAGGSVKLSETVLLSSEGRVHNGWIINGTEYELGAVVSNVQSDMVAYPRWFGHNINGVVWASTDLSDSKKFASTPEFIQRTASGGNFFSWNSLTPGSRVEDSYDPARDPCPEGWEVPSVAQVMHLTGFNSNSPLRFVGTRNGVKGYWFGIDRQPSGSELNDYLFIRCSGYFYNDTYSWDERFMLMTDELTSTGRVKYAYADYPTLSITFVEGANKNLASPIRCVRTNW